MGGGRDTRVAKRSFWMHQIAEYVIGISLVATGAQSTTPLIPVVLGAAVVLNTASADGPLSAFRRVSRGVHRVIDIVLAIVAVVACAAADIDTGVRIVMVLVVAVFVVVLLRTDYSQRSSRTERVRGDDGGTRHSGRADRVGRMAGRASGRVAGRVAARVRGSSRAEPGEQGSERKPSPERP